MTEYTKKREAPVLTRNSYGPVPGTPTRRNRSATVLGNPTQKIYYY